jgi:NADH-quinone oxidoreductase subunit L
MPHFLADFLQPVLLPTKNILAAHPELAHPISHSDEWLVMGLSVAISLVGIGVAFVMYLSRNQVPAAEPAKPGLVWLAQGKFFLDEIYGVLVVKPLNIIGHVFSILIDLLMVNLFVEGVAILARFSGSKLRYTQRGLVSGYAFLMVLSVLIFTVVFVLKLV